MKLTGTVVTGEGVAKKFLRIYDERLQALLGFTIYRGTLNVSVDPIVANQFLNYLTAKRIDGFLENKIRFGGVTVYPCTVNGKPGAVLRPDLTRHGAEIVEVICSEEISEKMIELDSEV